MTEENQNRIIYSLPCRLGLWNENLALLEEKNFITAYKRDHCQLLIQKTKKMFRNVLKPTVLAEETPYVMYGQNYQIVTYDIKAEGGFNGLYLAGVLSEREIDTVQHFRHGCTILASAVKDPCVRNTFRIVGCDSEKAGQPVPYGEDVYIQICESEDRPLCIQCQNEGFGDSTLTLRLSESPDIYCRFKFINWLPQRRYETMGTNFAPNSRVIIQHTATGKFLAIQQHKWVPSFYGPECIVTCEIYRDSHKMETAENFWKIVSRPISNTALYIRAAKGEDVPSELFD